MKNKKVNILGLLFVIAIFSLFFIGCKTKIQYVPVETVKNEYIKEIQRDSIRYYDSIYVRDKGDTIFLEKYKYIYRDRYRNDTTLVVDTIKVPYPVIQEKEVNRLSSFQSFQIWCGRILLLFILLLFVIRLVKR